MDIAIKTLRAAKVASAEIPVPGLSTALEITLGIVEKIKEVKEAREDCRALAERAAVLSLEVYRKLKEGGADVETRAHITTLLQALQDIEAFMERSLRYTNKRFGWIRFAVRHGSITKRIEELKTRLNDAVNVFLVQAAIGTEQKMDVIVDTHVRVLQHVQDSERVGDIMIRETGALRADVSKLAQNSDNVYDGTFRYFARENLELTEVIDDDLDAEPSSEEEDSTPATPQQLSGRVTRYRGTVKAAGELTGRQVVVHFYPGREDRRFVEDVKFVKRVCHPYIVAALGYSRPGGPGEAAFLVLEDYYPVEPHLSRIRGIDNLRIKLKMIKEICASIDHLEKMSFHVELHHDTRGTHSLQSYAIRADEIMFDSRNGGHFKWVRDPLMPRQACYANWGRMLSGPPLTWANRKALVKRLLPVIHDDASAEDVVTTWFWLIQTYPWIVNMGRGMCDVQPYSPQGIAHVGEWLALDRDSKKWLGLAADDQIRTLAGFTTDLSTLGSPAAEQTGTANGASLNVPAKRTFGQLAGYDGQDADCELTHDVCVDGLRWTRYLVQRMPVGTTFVFLQALDPDGSGDVSNAIRAVAATTPPETRYMGIVTGRQYLFDTTLTHTTQPGQEVPASLWFFVLRRDRDQGVDHDCSTPWAFWSNEREPVSIPSGITYDSTPRFEPLSNKPQNPVFAWTQDLGGLIFSIQATLFHRFTMLTQDEVLALQQLREQGFCAAAPRQVAQPDARARIEEIPECVPGMYGNGWRDAAAAARSKQVPGAGTPFRTVHTRGRMAIQRLLGCLRDRHG